MDAETVRNFKTLFSTDIVPVSCVHSCGRIK